MILEPPREGGFGVLSNFAVKPRLSSRGCKAKKLLVFVKLKLAVFFNLTLRFELSTVGQIGLACEANSVWSRQQEPVGNRKEVLPCTV